MSTAVPNQLTKPPKAESAFVIPPECIPNTEDFVIEDDTPLDGRFAEKQARLLTESLYSSWHGPGEGRPFLAFADVGWFYSSTEPPLVPDMFLSLDAVIRDSPRKKAGNTYFQWLVGKPPEIAVEIVSDKRGGEEGEKKKKYARLGLMFYVVLDPRKIYKGDLLRIYELQRGKYSRIEQQFLPEIGLGLTLWKGTYEDLEDTWLRWTDADGRLIPTGKERADAEHQRAEKESQRAKKESQRAKKESQRADKATAELERLQKLLRQKGIEINDQDK